MLKELVLQPRRNLAKWANITKQTPNIKIGYSTQYLASLVTGVEGQRTGARGHDLRDKSEVKSCSRVDQLDKCRNCKAAVAGAGKECPECGSTNIKRNNDSECLLRIRSEVELKFPLDEVPRIVFIISDYQNYDAGDWSTLQFQVFEIWPQYERHIHLRNLMMNYFHNIYLPHIEKNPRATPAPNNFWPYSFQFYMCNPARTFHCVVTDALENPQINVLEYIGPTIDRATVEPVRMPVSLLKRDERDVLHSRIDDRAFTRAEKIGLDERQRMFLPFRDIDHASPHSRVYQRGVR